MKPTSNPQNPFVPEVREHLESPAPVTPDIYEETAKTILSHNTSPDLPFRWSVNPYRGCFHACAYCYARPTHEYWGFGSGTDFESKLVVKINAPVKLQEALHQRSWQGELIVFSGNTDPYQPLEATYQLTRSCLQVCAEFHNPVGLISKSALIMRDIDVLQELNKTAWVRVFLSIPFASDDIARKVEPQAPSITKRFETLEQLSKAGISTAVSIAPVIPGLNEHDIPQILSRAHDAGAQHAAYILLRLNDNVEQVFVERMTHHFPDRIQKILARLKEVRQGQVGERTFFKRHVGKGSTWDVIAQLFETASRKHGFSNSPDTPIPSTFRRPGPTQLSLFKNPPS
ncbi:MAG: PA0069 family radical SAM protein [Nitrospirales bacterium]|nr:PA0069 family radical SAM protein [Nitrospirales bacterium]